MKNKERREMDIEAAKKELGWAYYHMKWLTKNEARLANKTRDELLKSLPRKARYSFMRNKLHIGKLSPGCEFCGKGFWSCLYINDLCTANCFFCPQDRKIKKESSPRTDQLSFNNPTDYVDFLEKLDYKGIGFSGGDPLLVFEKLLSYIKKIKQRFGKKAYVWLYTNGIFINKNKLQKLSEGGLDEIRFNISAGNYDLRPVKLATAFFDAVTVEIPAIPEDLEIVKKCLPELEKMGVSYLNLHQLIASRFNYQNFVRRGYTFLHQPNVCIFESEMTALRLMKYILVKKIHLPVNYCSAIYKNRLQLQGWRARSFFLAKEGYDQATDNKYIRTLSLLGSPTTIKKVADRIKASKCRSEWWALNDYKTEIFLHGSLLRYIDFDDVKLNARYFNIEIQSKTMADHEGAEKEILLNAKTRFFARKTLAGEQKELSPLTCKIFQKLFIEKKNTRQVLNYFVRAYSLKSKSSVNQMKKLIAQVGILLGKWERPGEGVPQLY